MAAVHGLSLRSGPSTTETTISLAVNNFLPETCAKERRDAVLCNQPGEPHIAPPLLRRKQKRHLQDPEPIQEANKSVRPVKVVPCSPCCITVGHVCARHPACDIPLLMQQSQSGREVLPCDMLLHEPCFWHTHCLSGSAAVRPAHAHRSACAR